MLIYCVNCKEDIQADLVNGEIVYPHRADLHSLLFYKCPNCGGFVGTHKGTDKPLGCIPTPGLKKARMYIHNRMDKLWKTGRMRRTSLYNKISEKLGYEYHTAQTRSIEECNSVIKIIAEIENSLI